MEEVIRTEIKKLIQEVIEQAQKSGKLPVFDIPDIQIVSPPVELQDSADYSTNIALVLSRIISKTPIEIASTLSDIIMSSNKKLMLIEQRHDRGFGMKVLNPGFINFILPWDVFCEELEKILEQKENYGKSDLGQNKKAQVEFISANPTGPLTLGNGRGGFYGDVLANILAKTGFDVEREYYVNDVGEQIKKLGHSILDDEQAVYRGEYISDLRDKLDSRLRGNDKKDGGNGKRESGNDNHDAEKIGKQAAEIIMQEMIMPTIEKKMKIKFDGYFNENSLYEDGKVDEIIDYLKEKKLAYEQEGALWFKSTQFGDEKDRVLIKADGEKTYLASDIAYLKNKFERKFNKLVYIWGADHHGYVGRIKAAASALGYNSDDIEIIIMQLVRLMSGGKEIRMSKRAGTYIALDELLDEISLDVARFFFLMYSPDTHMNFDLDLAKEHSQKNPVYYVQYAYARMHSIFKKSDKPPRLPPLSRGGLRGDELRLNDPNILKLLEHENELKLIKQLIKFPEIIEDIAKDYQVHRLPHYALDLVRQFHKFYEKCRVIDERNPDLTEARLALVGATQIVLKNVLDLMGISAPEKM